ncbi:MAG: PDR/VanB family oxidoreductase [Asticcacaulis sp.]|uniref:PDR/VanB family oxidoreductase n=1 Tax=Asticcacaulis sp. TaxID=1872648 RepID=UPI0039E3BF79
MADAEIQVLIRAIRYEAEGVLSFELEALDGASLPEFAPGAHIDVHLPNGLMRQYSVTNASNGRHYIIGVGLDRASRGGSRWLHDQARPGQVLTISAPRNTFPMAEPLADAVLFAGGIGITPIRAMAGHLAGQGVPWTLYYAARSRKAAAFASDLRALDGDLRLHLDDEMQGLLDIAAAVAAVPSEAHLYCCGPEPMIAAFLEATKDRAPDHVHVEHFGAVAPLADDGGLVIELARSGRVVEVRPDHTILEAVLAAGVSAPSSCRNGVCGTCETRVLAGEPDHRDLILSEAEKAAGDTMMICCSRAKSPRLTLDL